MTLTPPGMLPFADILARWAQAKLPEAWQTGRADERAVLQGELWGSFQHRAALRPGTLASEAYAALRPMLAEGRLPAMLRVQTGAPRPIPSASWLAAGVDNLGALLASHVGFVLDGGAVERGAVLMAEEALQALIDGRPAPPLPTIAFAPEPPRNRGGAPKRHDGETFLIIACRIACR